MSETREYFDRMAARWDEMPGPPGELIDYMLSLVDVPPRGRILDSGCGTGVLLPHLAALLGEAGRLYAADLSPAMLARARSRHPALNVTYLEADLADLPLPPGHLDLVMCLSMFPHVDDKDRALREVQRVLKPGGTVMIAHAAGRETINRRHSELGGVVSDHLLPAGSCLAIMLEGAGLRPTHIEDDPERYLVAGVKTDG